MFHGILELTSEFILTHLSLQSLDLFALLPRPRRFDTEEAAVFVKYYRNDGWDDGMMDLLQLRI